MTDREKENAGGQLLFSFTTNRNFDNPSDLHLCNFDVNSMVGKRLLRTLPNILTPEFPLNIHSNSFMDIFDKEKLVYLTPDCSQELIEYNPDDIYIIGAMVDKTRNKPLSFEKAKSFGLRMAKLPIDRYLSYQGGKRLAINHVVQILLKLKVGQSWENIFNSTIPERRIIGLRDPRIYNEEEAKARIEQKKIFYRRIRKEAEERLLNDKLESNN